MRVKSVMRTFQKTAVPGCRRRGSREKRFYRRLGLLGRKTELAAKSSESFTLLSIREDFVQTGHHSYSFSTTPRSNDLRTAKVSRTTSAMCRDTERERDLEC
jgi:hypothetical protein